MNLAVETQPNCRAVIRIDIPTNEVEQERERVTANYVKQAKLPGFRPGKAPKAVVAKKFDSQIRQELESELIRNGQRAAVKRDDVEVLNFVSVKEQAFHPDQSYSFTLEVSTVPKFELPEYKGIPVKLPKIEVTDEDVDHDLLHLRERYQTFTDVERPAALDDFVVVQAEGLVDGQSMEEAHPEAPAFLKKIEGNWFQLSEAEKFLPGFFSGLVGISKGEERELSITLPEDSDYDALRGKTMQFKVKAEAVKERNLPEANEDFAKKLNAEWDMETLRTEIRKAVQHRREQAREESKTNQVIQHLSEKLEFELPQDVVARETQHRTNDIAMNAMRQGMDEAAIMNVQDKIVDAAKNQAQQTVKVRFILNEIAKKEGITVTEDQLRRAFGQIAMQRKISPKKLLAEAQKTNLVENLRIDLLLENSVQFLRDQAAVEEVEAEKEDCGHQH